MTPIPTLKVVEFVRASRKRFTTTVRLRGYITPTMGVSTANQTTTQRGAKCAIPPPPQRKMGDRITTYLPCPKCGKKTEQYDASSSLLWVWNCEHCGWHDPRSYYEVDETHIVFCTEEEARMCEKKNTEARASLEKLKVKVKDKEK